jgi:hypothetical protein
VSRAFGFIEEWIMCRKSLSFAAVVVVVLSALPGIRMARAKGPLQVTVDANSVWIREGMSPVLQYRYGDVPFKPYVKELYTPAGVNVLLDAPSDHLHHHGLMFAVAVNEVNFWEETPTAGRQETQGPFTVVLHDEDGGGPSAGFSAGPAWVKTTATSRMTYSFEARTIKACQVGKLGGTVVIWQSELPNLRPRRSMTLSGSHYFGLGLRFVRSMDGGQFFNADGKEGTIFRGEERLVRSNWCAYTAAVDGKPVTVAMLGHPGNPRRPTTWFTMAKPFAYLSGTLNLHEEPLSIEFGKSLLLRYAVVAWDGKVGKERIDEAYRWFISEYPVPPGVYTGTKGNHPDR